MKKILILALIFSVGITIFADIKNIVSISNPEFRFNYDVASRPIFSYENRLIVSNGTKTEEYLILPDGQLEFISYFDVSSAYTMMSGNRLIIPNRIPYRGFFLFDLSVSPMELITYVDTNGIVNPGNWRNVTFFNETHIMVQNQFQNRIHLFAKETGNYEGFIPGISTSFTYIDLSDEVYIQINQYQDGLGLQLFSMLEDGSFELISSSGLTTYGRYLDQIIVDGTNIYIATDSHLFITDISNPANPRITNSIRLNRDLISFYYTGDFIYTFDRNHNFMVYELNSLGNYQRIHTQKIEGITFGITPHSLHYVEPYLYLNGEISLFVFDTENDFEIVNRHGAVSYLTLFSVSNNDVYYVEVDLFKRTQTIYSVLDNTIIATLNYQHMSTEHSLPSWPVSFMHFHIIEDRLYVSTVSNNVHIFDIYHLENQQATRINRVFIGGSEMPAMVIIDDRVFFSYYNSSTTTVYELINDDLSLLNNFSGKLQYRWASQPTDFVLNANNNTLIVRDINLPTNILFQRSINNLSSDSAIFYIDDNHFAVMNNRSSDNYFSHVNFIDIKTGNNNLLISIRDRTLVVLNGIITAFMNSSGVPNISEIYTIRDGELVLLKTMDYGNRAINWNWTYFFPEREKMVLVAPGGIWVYDVEFETSSEYENPDPIVRNELLSNYPNPFNPETTIEFIVRNSEFGVRSYAPPMKNEWGWEGGERVSIDIYNIRGQKVRSLLDGLFESGSHTVVWDGRDDSGRELGSGVYLYRMVAGEETSVRKMVLLK